VYAGDDSKYNREQPHHSSILLDKVLHLEEKGVLGNAPEKLTQL
jgi:hypothetical protein